MEWLTVGLVVGGGTCFVLRPLVAVLSGEPLDRALFDAHLCVEALLKLFGS